MSDLTQQLADLLEEAGAKVTFSANCISGIIGRNKCRCWRCLGVEPEEEELEWEGFASEKREAWGAEVARDEAAEVADDISRDPPTGTDS